MEFYSKFRSKSILFFIWKMTGMEKKTFFFLPGILAVFCPEFLKFVEVIGTG